MKLPENPIARAVAVVLVLFFGVKAVGYILVVSLLILVSLPNHQELIAVRSEPEQVAQYWTNDLYLRNRTAAPLQVRAVAPRAAVRLDSIWWPLPEIPDAIGRAVLLRDSLTLGGLRYRAGRTLVLGTLDTLIDVHYAGTLPRSLAHCRRIDIRHSPELATTKFKAESPTYERMMRVQGLPAQPGSLHLTLYLEPGDTLALGHYRIDYNADSQITGVPGARVLAKEVPPAIGVQWQDAQGRRHQHHPWLANWLQWPAPANTRTGRQQVRHYLDYPLTYTTIIAR